MGKHEASRDLGSGPSLCDFDQVIGLLGSGCRWLNHMLSRAFLVPGFQAQTHRSPHIS